MTTDNERLNDIRELAARNEEPQLRDLKFVLEMFDRRVTELLTANTRLVEEKRYERGRADHFQSAVDFLLSHNGVNQLRDVENSRRLILEQYHRLQMEFDAVKAENEALKAHIRKQDDINRQY